MRKIFFGVVGGGLLLFLWLLCPTTVFAAAGDIYVDALDELGADLAGATLYYSCAGGAEQSCADGAGCDLDATADILVTPVGGASCDVGDAVTARLEKDGYVNSTSLGYGLYDNLTQNNGTAGNQFAYRIDSIPTESVNAELVATAGTTVLTGDGQTITCTLSGASRYCPVPVAHTTLAIRVGKTGYVRDITSFAFTTDRTANSDAQQTATTGAVKYAYKITSIPTESGTDLLTVANSVKAGDSQNVNCAHGADNNWYCPVPTAHTTLAIRVTEPGYVQDLVSFAFVNDRANNWDPQQTATAGSILYSYKITSVTTEIGADLTGLGTFRVGDATATNLCVLFGGVWYCPVTVANSNETMIGNLTLNGYIKQAYNLTTGTNRLANTDAQVTDTLTGVLYSHKVTGGDELLSGVTGATVTVGGTGCTENAGVYYCPTLTGADGGVNDVIVTKDGFVTWTTNSTNRTVNIDAQATYVSANQYAVKITATREGDNAALSGATVTAGAGATPCAEDGVTGIYFCAVPVADVGTNTSAAKAGFITNTSGTYVDRTADTDAQQAITVNNILFGLKVNVNDRSGAAVTALDTATFNSAAASLIASNVYYWADTAGAAALSLKKISYINGELDNPGFSSVTTGVGAQVEITMGNFAACSAPIAASANCIGMRRAGRPGGIDMPSNSSFTINSDAAQTTTTAVTLNLSSSSTTSMLISNDPNFIDATWETYDTTKAWTLIDGYGTKTVYVRFRSFSMNQSMTFTDTIEYVAPMEPTIPVTTTTTENQSTNNVPSESTTTSSNMPNEDSSVEATTATTGGSSSGFIALTAGDLFKVSGHSTVYYYGTDAKRHSFPNEATYYSWFGDFSGVKTIPAEQLATLGIGKNVTMRAGTFLLKITMDPKVYAVEPGNVLRWIKNEELAQSLYGATYATRVRDVNEIYFSDYTFGADVDSAIYPAGAIFKYADSANVYYMQNGLKRWFETSTAFDANYFLDKFIQAAPASFIVGDGANITAKEAAIANIY